MSICWGRWSRRWNWRSPVFSSFAHQCSIVWSDSRSRQREALEIVFGHASPDAPLFRHKYPGEEVIYVLEGSLEYESDGQPPRRVNAGEGLMIPADTIHAVRNIGSCNAAELATYIVEKGKPLLVVVD